ncbi:BTAD domain-containing putative transcriptional regulator [Actinoplanes sp. NPDC051494]|uniref:AfsR/SARP family transcriptional regulator n=1 Tax=Actinoplanes sp. NPDC051494 TaxID=3363907 RepID=UPI0037A16890
MYVVEVRFGILGPLVVTENGHEVAISAGRDRIVLAMLLLHAGRVVGADELVDAMWENDPPATARGQLQTCVSRLRRLLAPGTIRTDPAGYAVVAGDGDLDAAVFARLTARAREPAVPPDQATKLFREALGIWRGAALAGLDAPGIRRAATVLDEQYTTAVEEWIDLELDAGHEREIVADVAGLVESHPLRERLRVQLMLVLYRVGRRADALAEYARARELLRDELGIDPGSELQDLHRRILTGEVTPAGPARSPVRRLPRSVGDFTGRDEVVARLLGAAATTTVLSIDGMAGSGKTTLALRVAELVGDAYPDAQLFLDLQGHSEGEPLEPGVALVSLLRQLGVEADRIPADLEDRAGMWRSELADRRALVVLDNAASSAQVRRLLPASPTNLCVVTSRRRLAGLDGGHLESLEVLDEPEAVALLGRIVGARVAAEPVAALDLVRRCGCLPLAVRLAGARLAHRPRWAVADLVQRLGESALPALAAEDRTVANAFALSYGQLPEAAQRLFRLLGLFPGERFRDVPVAALTGLPLADARDIIDELVDVHLVEEPDPGRYRLHDLVRQYAVTLADGVPEMERRTAVAALVDLYVHVASALNIGREAAGTAVDDFPRGSALRPDLVAAAVAEPAWLEEQRPDLVALVRLAAAHRGPGQAWLMARVNWRYLYDSSYLDDVEAVMTAGLTAAEEAGDEQGVALMNNYLASALYRGGRTAEALECMSIMLRHQERIGNREGVARARANYAGVLNRLGRTGESLHHAELARRDWRLLGMNLAVARSHTESGLFLIGLGRYEEATRMNRIALQSAVELRFPQLVLSILQQLGEIRVHLGRFDMAERLLRASQTMLRRFGPAYREIEFRRAMGLLENRRGQHEKAVEWYLSAIDLSRRFGQVPATVLASNELGAVLFSMGNLDGAVALYRRALELAQQTGYAVEKARALRGLGICLLDADPLAAGRYRRQAEVIFEQLESGMDQLQAVQDGGRMEA